MDFPIKTVDELEKLSSQVTWQYFEKLVAFIFEKNGFHVQQNVIIKDGSWKRQIDVLATRYDLTYVVECKKWKGKQRNLKPAIGKHLERCSLYEHIYGNCKPLIVTLLDDSIDGEIPIVPIMKLNAFLNEEI